MTVTPESVSEIAMHLDRASEHAQRAADCARWDADHALAARLEDLGARARLLAVDVQEPSDA